MKPINKNLAIIGLVTISVISGGVNWWQQMRLKEEMKKVQNGESTVNILRENLVQHDRIMPSCFKNYRDRATETDAEGRIVPYSPEQREMIRECLISNCRESIFNFKSQI